MKPNELKQLIENTIKSEIRAAIMEEASQEEVYIIKNKKGEPIEICKSEEEANEKKESYEKGNPDQEFIIEKGSRPSLDELDEMGENLENMENNQPMDEKLIGKQKNIDKNHNGKIDAQDFKILRGQSEGEQDEEEECYECGQEMYEAGSTFPEVVDNDVTADMAEEQDPQEFHARMCDECGGMIDEETGMCDECGYSAMDEHEMDHDGYYTPTEKQPVHEGACNECGGMIDEETGMCSECGYGPMNEEKCENCGKPKGMCECYGTFGESTKKKTIRLSETEMVNLIKKIVSEAVPGMATYEKAHRVSGQENKKGVADIMKDVEKTQLKAKGTTKPEFPNQEGKGDEKAARVNSKEEDEYVEDWRGGNPLQMTYDSEPSKQFKDRMTKSLEGDSTTGNSQDAANVIKSDLGKKMAKAAKRKIEKVHDMPMYIKDPAPTREVGKHKPHIAEGKDESKQVINEEIQRMKDMFTYNKKTQ
jgi:hypothetical protein